MSAELRAHESNGGDPLRDLRDRVDLLDAEIYGRRQEEGLREMVSGLRRDMGDLRRSFYLLALLLLLLTGAVATGAWALVDIAHSTKVSNKGDP